MGEPGRELTCREVVELVNDYLEGALTADEEELFERHLSSCEGCRRYVDQMRLTIDAVGRIGEADVPAATRDRLLTAFRDWKRSA
jgi:predicted anti-sigma-YlaC factor YlaD